MASSLSTSITFQCCILYLLIIWLGEQGEWTASAKYNQMKLINVIMLGSLEKSMWIFSVKTNHVCCSCGSFSWINISIPQPKNLILCTLFSSNGRGSYSCKYMDLYTIYWLFLQRNPKLTLKLCSLRSGRVLFRGKTVLALLSHSLTKNKHLL